MRVPFPLFTWFHLGLRKGTKYRRFDEKGNELDLSEQDRLFREALTPPWNK
jgi:hypothetical protein